MTRNLFTNLFKSMGYFTPSQQFDAHINVGPPSNLDEQANISAPQIDIATTTPPQKRRRGRPPKCPSNSDNQTSPAAHLSAAVVKQGTPKASAPLMRISPLKVKRKDSNTSPIQRLVNPSPKGGLLMKLSNDEEKPAVKRIKRSSSTSSASTIYSVTSSDDKDKNNSNNGNLTVNTFMSPPKITLTAQEGIQSLTNEPSHNKNVKTSVNPSLLLSSPMPNSHGFSNKKRKTDIKSSINKSAAKLKARSQNSLLSSSPTTPNSLASSCFSSIIQSSPLYHGYYANLSSPSNTLSSSPIKFQMKPIDLPEFKKGDAINDLSLPKIDELPKNPFNSPNLKPQDVCSKPTSISKGEFQLSFSIDEHGQAQVTKTKAPSKPKAPDSTVTRPQFTRHESLMNINQPPYNLGRSISLSNIHQHKAQPSISGVLEESSSQDYNEMFIEPLKMSSDPLLSEFDEAVQLESINISEGANLIDCEDELDDENMNFDARKALIKMIRRSI